MNTEGVKNGVFTVFEKGAKLSDLRGSRNHYKFNRGFNCVIDIYI